MYHQSTRELRSDADREPSFFSISTAQHPQMTFGVGEQMILGGVPSAAFNSQRRVLEIKRYLGSLPPVVGSDRSGYEGRRGQPKTFREKKSEPEQKTETAGFGSWTYPLSLR